MPAGPCARQGELRALFPPPCGEGEREAPGGGRRVKALHSDEKLEGRYSAFPPTHSPSRTTPTPPRKGEGKWGVSPGVIASGNLTESAARDCRRRGPSGPCPG